MKSLKSLVKAFLAPYVLRATSGKESEGVRVHGLGMLQFYLPDDSRLHIWDHRLIVPGVSLLHTHAWAFESTIVSGKLYNHRYALVDPERRTLPGALPYYRSRIECGPNAVPTAPERKHAALQDRRGYIPLETYVQQPDEIHETRADSGTITLISRKRRANDPDHAYVYWPADQKFVSALPRQPSAIEILQVCGDAIRKLDKE
jgi:hypothetical protein